MKMIRFRSSLSGDSLRSIKCRITRISHRLINVFRLQKRDLPTTTTSHKLSTFSHDSNLKRTPACNVSDTNGLCVKLRYLQHYQMWSELKQFKSNLNSPGWIWAMVKWFKTTASKSNSTSFLGVTDARIGTRMRRMRPPWSLDALRPTYQTWSNPK